MRQIWNGSTASTVGRVEEVNTSLIAYRYLSKNEAAYKRLKYMTKTENGFEIAEKDLEFRGAEKY